MNRKILEPKVGMSTVAQNMGENLGAGSRYELLNQNNNIMLDADNICVIKDNKFVLSSSDLSPITTVNLGDASQLIAILLLV